MTAIDDLSLDEQIVIPSKVGTESKKLEAEC